MVGRVLSERFERLTLHFTWECDSQVFMHRTLSEFTLCCRQWTISRSGCRTMRFRFPITAAIIRQLLRLSAGVHRIIYARTFCEQRDWK
jgi:hypothetical protein